MMQALFAQADEDFSHIDQQEVVTALKDVLPAAMVLHTDEQLRPYECDSFMLMAHLPLAVVLPETEAQVVIAIQTCARLKSEEHTSELQSRGHLVCRLLLEKKKEQDIEKAATLGQTVQMM